MTICGVNHDRRYVLEDVLKVYVNVTCTIQKECDTSDIYANSVICICP